MGKLISLTPTDRIFYHLQILLKKYKQGDLTLEEAIYNCENSQEVGELIKTLILQGEIDEDMYNDAMSSLSKKGKLGKFMATI